MTKTTFEQLDIGQSFKMTAESVSIFMKVSDVHAICTNSQNSFDCPMKKNATVIVKNF